VHRVAPRNARENPAERQSAAAAGRRGKDESFNRASAQRTVPACYCSCLEVQSCYPERHVAMLVAVAMLAYSSMIDGASTPISSNHASAARSNSVVIDATITLLAGRRGAGGEHGLGRI
jgi:hypothetical protein